MANTDEHDDQIHKFGLNESQVQRFGGILRAMNLEAIPAFASNIRQFGHPTTGIISKSFCNFDMIPCKIVDLPLCGSFHIVFTLEFDDGVKWMLKISANGHRFDSVAAAALISEARTMQLLKRETTIPVPVVYAFDASSSNELNSPFILMERLDGKPLWQGWFDDEIPKARLEHFRIKVLQNLAEAMAQLNKFTLNRGGALEFDTSGRPVGLRGAKVVDAVAMYNQGVGFKAVSESHQSNTNSHDYHDGLDEGHGDGHDSAKLQDTDHISKDERTEKDDKDQTDDEDDEDIICEKGPFECPKTAFLFDVDRSNVYRQGDKYTQGCYKALRIFIDLAFANFDDPGRRFVLTHPDFDVQNVLVADDGTLRGLIDWDGVASVPREVGCAQYPLWLMRDWVPYYYVYDEQGGKTEEDADYEESSPAELASYRAMYAHFMEKEIERQTGGPDLVTTFGTLPKQEARLTRRSLIMRDLNLAGSSPFLTTNVMCHILNQIEQVTEADWGDMDVDLVGSDFDSSCSSEGVVDSDSDTNFNNNSDSDEKDPETDVVETDGDALSLTAADAGGTMLGRVVSRALVQVTEDSTAISQHFHESETLSNASRTEAEKLNTVQSSKTDLKAEYSSRSAPLGWGRRLLCFGCNTAEKALRRLATVGHTLEDTVNEVLEAPAEAGVHHQNYTEHPNEEVPGQAASSLGHQKLGVIEASEVTEMDRLHFRNPTRGMLEPIIPSAQATAQLHSTLSTQDMDLLEDSNEIASIIQPILMQDIPARKAELIEAEKARRKNRYRTDKAAMEEELKVWERIALMVWSRGISLEQLRENQFKIAHWVVDTLQADKKHGDDLVKDSSLHSAPDSAEQGAMQSNEEPKPSIATSCKPQSQAVGTPLQSISFPSSRPRPIAEDLLQRVMSSDSLKSLYSFGMSCLRKFFSNSNQSEDDIGSLTSDSSVTGSDGGDSNKTDTGNSCKSSDTSLSDDEVEHGEKAETKEEKDVFKAKVDHAARNDSGERGMNGNSDVWEEPEMSEAMAKVPSQKDPKFSGTLGTGDGSEGPWLPRRVYDPCSGEWVEFKEPIELTKTGLKKEVAETETMEDSKDGIDAQSEERLEDENDDNDEGDFLSDLGNGEPDFKTFRDDGEFRSRNIFTLLGMDMLDEIRLLRMQEGFLKLLEQF